MTRCRSCGHDMSTCPACGKKQSEGEHTEPIMAAQEKGFSRKVVTPVTPARPVRKGR